jgi:hypothetical protein
LPLGHAQQRSANPIGQSPVGKTRGSLDQRAFFIRDLDAKKLFSHHGVSPLAVATVKHY